MIVERGDDRTGECERPATGAGLRWPIREISRHDLTTAASEFMANVMASAAQWERRIIGQRTKDALAVKRALGVRLGRPQTMAADVVARIRAAHEAGAGWSAIARDLNAEAVPTAHGGTKWYPSTVRAVVLADAS
jgi:hypothetical protein